MVQYTGDFVKVTCSTFVLQCCSRQAIPMEQGITQICDEWQQLRQTFLQHVGW